MATRFCGLGHDHVSLDLDRLTCFVEVGHLDNQTDPRISDNLGEWAWITEGQHDRVWFVLKGPFERLSFKSPRQEPDPPREVRGHSDRIELTLQPGPIATTAADEAEAAAVGHRVDERPASNVTHRRQRHRVRHAK